MILINELKEKIEKLKSWKYILKEIYKQLVENNFIDGMQVFMGIKSDDKKLKDSVEKLFMKNCQWV